jgi:NAD-dependent dihydropyrimidine dehydrogenase PreA subunit
MGGDDMGRVLIGWSAAITLFIFWLWIERWHLILPGTWPALKWLGFRRTLTGGLHGIWYGRHITSYINFLRKMAHIFGPEGHYAQWLENTYHGKILSTELARSIVSVKEDVPLQDLGVSVIPYSRARDIVIEAPPDIVLAQCGCKEVHHRIGNPCRMYDWPYMTCILIGKPLTDFLLDHKPTNTRRITNIEALDLLERFHNAGLVHAAWFKDCIKDQFYVICNCCSCCCLGFETLSLGFHQFASSGYVAQVDEAACLGCGTALAWCPFGAIEIINGKSTLRWEKCMGCGVFISKCPQKARHLKPDTRRGMPMDVRNLITGTRAVDTDTVSTG